jgi:magnesium transporter
MGYEPVSFLYLSEVLGTPVTSLRTNTRLGRVVDIAASTGQVYPKVTWLLVSRLGTRVPFFVPWSCVRRSEYTKKILADHNGESTGPSSAQDILLKKSFLDRQIISTTGYKLVRVNDLQLLIDNSPRDNSNLYLVHIDIGFKGLLRRLGWLHPVNAAVKWLISRDLKDQFVSWKYAQPTTTTNIQGSLQLSTDASKLDEMHPADLADILEDLGTDERISLLESLDPEAAASTMQEMPLRIRAQVAETLDTAKLAAIIQAMQQDESVDLLDEMASDKRAALFTALPEQTVAELKELSKLSAFSVGSIMNTEFIAVQPSLTAGAVLERIKEEARHAELIYYVFVLDSDDRLTGVASLRSILTSPPETPLADLVRENVVSIPIDERIKDVAQIFLKYNFEAVPVVDAGNHILGIVTLRDTLESVYPKMREASES